MPSLMHARKVTAEVGHHRRIFFTVVILLVAGIAVSFTAFLALGYPSTMAKSWVAPGRGPWGNLLTRVIVGVPDGISSATPLAAGKGGVLTPPLDLFIGRIPGSAGETSAIAILIGGTFLLLVGIANWRTVLSILLSFVALTSVFHGLNLSNATPVWFNILSGGILFGAFFMATDPVSGPITISGKWMYGILIGVITVLIRFFSGMRFCRCQSSIIWVAGCL